MSDNTQDFNFLQGVKVVDFTQFEAGTTRPRCWPGSAPRWSRLEPGAGGSRLPAAPGKPDDDPEAPVQCQKKSITLNLKSPKGLKSSGDAEEG
jgi:hypothetical protein